MRCDGSWLASQGSSQFREPRCGCYSHGPVTALWVQNSGLLSPQSSGGKLNGSKACKQQFMAIEGSCWLVQGQLPKFQGKLLRELQRQERHKRFEFITIKQSYTLKAVKVKNRFQTSNIINGFLIRFIFSLSTWQVMEKGKHSVYLLMDYIIYNK